MRYAPDSPEVAVTLRQRGKMAEIEVRDEGPGIPKEVVPHLFERFYRMPRSNDHAKSGLGLGLYITKQLVTAHNGSINVASQDGAGTTFIITLPLVPQ
jgi:signal transduction histidine kinase